MTAPSKEVIELSQRIMNVIGKRKPLEAAQALLLCIRAVTWIANPKNDIAAQEGKS